MIIKNLKIENFRNFEFEQIDFCDGLNIFYGLNGQGKTNLLEAVNYFTNGKSCRNNLKERDVIKFGAQRASLAAEFDIKGTSVYEKIDLDSKKSIYINGSPVEKLSDILGLVNTVLFMPSDIEYVTGAPSLRRDWVDSFLSKNKPGYFKLLSSYIYVLKQKNNILKARGDNSSYLEIYNEKLFEYGSKICEVRSKFIEVFAAYANHIYGQISENREKINFEYKPNIEKFYDREYFLGEIEKFSEKEQINGVSLRGAHRDDISITIGGKSARHFASQGQLRSIVLAMKTAEGEIINDTKGEYPIILLDDVLSELDSARREFLFSTLSGKQVIITLTNADIGKKDGKAAYFEIEGGKIKK